MGGLILGVNTLYMLFCFFKLLALVGKGLIDIEVMSMQWIKAVNLLTSVKECMEMYVHINLQWPNINCVSYIDFCSSASLLHALAL